MKNLLFFVLVVLLSSCSQSEMVNETSEFDVQLKSSERGSILVRDYGSNFAIYHETSGEFLYCHDCENNLDLREDLLLSNGEVAFDMENNTITLTAPELKSAMEFGFDKKAQYTISGFGWSVVDISNSATAQDAVPFSWTFDDWGEVEAISCQCVHTSSTPCSPSGNDAAGCDVGGEGSPGCGVSSTTGANGGMTILGTGASGGGSTGSGCSITCDTSQGLYACCHY